VARPWQAGLSQMTKWTLPLALLLGASLAVACSSSSNPASKPCNEDPWECPTGQTCWPVTGGSFQCLNSGPGTLYSACQDTLGVPTCTDGFACVQVTTTSGACSPYCDNTNTAHACPSGLTCETGELIASSGAQIQVCAGGTLLTNGGGDASTGPDSSNTPADAAGTPVEASPGDAGPIDAGTDAVVFAL
jgi:hypothetical protein